MLIEIDVDGELLTSDSPPGTTLLSFLRGHGLTGTKDSCSRGECGACTVLVADRPALACLTLAGRVREPVRTVEGLAEEARALRESFADHGALQCGFCTPGQMVTAWALLASASDLVPAGDLGNALDGNLCRCTGSVAIAAAVRDLMENRDGGR